MDDSINLPEKIELIALRLRAARAALGYTKRIFFSTAAGVPQTSYRAHELALDEMKTSDLLYYSEKLRISTGWLLTGQGSPFDGQPPPSTEEEAKFTHHLKEETAKMHFDRLTQLEKEVSRKIRDEGVAEKVTEKKR